MAYTAMGRRYHYYVYVIELSKDVLYEARFKRANPDYVIGKPCVYGVLPADLRDFR
jgi:hypothetical protein